MSKAIRFHQPGGVEVLQYETVEPPPPAPGEARVRQTWAGVNFVDVYHREGLYPVPSMPAALGVEAAGVVEALGEGVTGLRVGDRVAWSAAPLGGYAQRRNVVAERLVSLPQDVGERAAAAVMLRGLTAHMLLRLVRPVGPGDTILVHAAAGGLGLILTQWAKRLGAVVIGTVGSEAKAAVASRAGVDHVVLYRQEDFVAAVRRLTGGAGVDVVYDGVGGETLLRSLDCARPFGMVVSVGQASGSIPDIPLAELGARRSLALARPSVFAYAADLARYRAAAEDVLALVRDGLSVEIGAEFGLADAAEAHGALEGGRTTGSLLLNLD